MEKGVQIMKIRSVAVLGAGAVGAYILYGLSQTKDVEFCVVADGARKERLERDGILIDDKKAVRIFRPAVRTSKTPGPWFLYLLRSSRASAFS